MNEFENDPSENPDSSTGSSAQIGLALLSAAFCIFIFSQISNLGQNASSMKWQSENLNRQIQSLTGAEKNAQDLIKQREATVQQTQQMQERYTSLLTDILQLADTDPDAKSVVEKYKIARQKTDSAPAVVTPVSGPTNP
jgi:chromosome segregation ATPase